MKLNETPENDALTDTAPVRIDRKGRMYVRGKELARSRAFRARLAEMVELGVPSTRAKGRGRG